MVIGLDLMKKIKIKWSYSMARNWLGQKIIRDAHDKARATDSDIKWENFKMFLWIVFGYTYFHFVIMGWNL